MTIQPVKVRRSVGGEYFKSTPAEGAIYVVVQYSYKNISDKPIGTFSKPSFNLVDANGVKYDSDAGASGSLATELKLSEKVLSDLNPGITVKGADAYEISKESWEAKGWNVLVKADKKVMFPIN